MEERFYQKQWFKKALDTTIILGFLATASVGLPKSFGYYNANVGLREAEAQHNPADIMKYEGIKEKNKVWEPWMLGAGLFYLAQFYRSRKS